MDKNNTLILLVAGSSKRFLETSDSKIKKQFVCLHGKPVFIHTLIKMVSFNFSSIVVVCSAEDKETVRKYINEESLIKKYKNIIDIVEGGSERVYSVYNAMKFLKEKYKEEDIDNYVFIHDGVRPLIEECDIDRLKESVYKNNAAILAIKINDTVKKTNENNIITDTLERDCLYRAVTPQAFLFNNYFPAIEKYIDSLKKCLINRVATDDAEIYSMYGGSVSVVVGNSKNIKITTKEDFDIFSLFY